MDEIKKPLHKDYKHVRSIAYNIRQVISEINNLSPEAKKALSESLENSDMAIIKDFETLQKILKKLSF